MKYYKKFCSEEGDAIVKAKFNRMTEDNTFVGTLPIPIPKLFVTVVVVDNSKVDNVVTIEIRNLPGSWF